MTDRSGPRAPGNRPVLVLGCPRSGTTLLQLMLHAHPRLVAPPENRHVLPAWDRREEWGDLGREANRRRLASFVTGTKSAIWEMGLDRAVVAEHILAAPPTLGSALEAVQLAFAEHVGAERWCDKRPLYVRHVPALRRLFPDAMFVNLTRDGRAAAASLIRMPWFDHGLEQAIGTWLLAVEHADAARASLPADTWFDLRYEDLVTDPEAELRRLCGWLGEDFDPAMLKPAEVKGAVVPERKTWHANTSGPVVAARVESWRTELSAREVALLDAVAGTALRANGYAVGAERAERRRVYRFALAYRRRRLWYARRQAAEAWALRRRPAEVASRFAAARAMHRP
ncbi:MAG: sulfotransferase family protein [Sporichthyaceae bacterium]